MDSSPRRPSRAAIAAKWVGIAALTVSVLTFGLSFGSYLACNASIELFLLALPLSVAAVALGFAAKFQISRNRQLSGEEAARGAYKKGFGGLVLLLFMVVAISRDLPPCGERPARNEVSAFGSLELIDTACLTYASTYPKQGFPPSLKQLDGPAASGEQLGPEHADLIDTVLASGAKSGYVFTYTPGLPDGKGRIVTYTVVARAQQFGYTGVRNFFTDQTGVIHWTSEDRAPTTLDSPVKYKQLEDMYRGPYLIRLFRGR